MRNNAREACCTIVLSCPEACDVNGNKRQTFLGRACSEKCCACFSRPQHSPSEVLSKFGRQIFREKWNQRPSTKFYFGITKLEEDALNKTLIVGALAFAAVSIAQTANAAEFYVVRDATTKKCTIVDSKPTTTTTTIVDDGTFKTKTEAETGMKTMK